MIIMIMIIMIMKIIIIINKYINNNLVIFKLTDVDEDGCLLVTDLFNLFNRIERNFCKE